MELRKRSLANEDQQYRSKKSRTSLLKRRKSVIEDLSGEVWFELFAYFDGQSLVHSFSQLNSPIESLLNDSRLPIHLNPSSSNIPSPLNNNQIVSLHLDYSQIVYNDRIILQTSFLRLRSLSLVSITDQHLEEISKSSLFNLRQISIQSKCARFVTKILAVYFPYVKRVILNCMRKEFLVKSLDCDQRKSELEKLTLAGKIKLAKLFRLWSFVPKLRSLSLIDDGVQQCDYWMDENVISRHQFPLHLSVLHINIGDDDLTFSNLERLIPKTLRYLIVSGSMADDDFDDYISSENWIRLMSRCSATLQRIKLDISSYFDPGDLSGLKKTLFKFRKNPFFRKTSLHCENFHLTIQGFIEFELHINQ